MTGLIVTKPGQIAILGAQSIADPGTHGRMLALRVAGVQLQGGPERMGRVVGIHAVEQANVVDECPGMRHQFAPPHARITVAADTGHRLKQLAVLHAVGGHALGARKRNWPTVLLDQPRLVLEQVDL